MEWFYGLIGVAFLGLIGIVWNMLNEKIRDHKADCEKATAALWDQVGRDSLSGMRFMVHNATPMGDHVDLESRVDKLERR